MNRKPANPWGELAGAALIAPSLLACDFTRVGKQIDQVIASGAELLHLDVMDGHFVPNLSVGPAFLEKIRGYTDRPLDVHLMVTDPAYFLEQFAEAGADSITFHVEATNEPETLIARLRKRGLGVGITLRPGTPVETIKPLAAEVDLVLVMTVEPGYGGQSFMPEMLAKVAEVRGLLKPHQRLEVDGGIHPQSARRCAENGADVFVAGENIFGSKDIVTAMQALREATRAGVTE